MSSQAETKILKDKEVLLTGGCGFIGSEVAKQLSEIGANITILDNLSSGKESYVSNFENVNLVKGDIRDQDLLRELIPGHDVVIHLACISNDPSFELNPDLGKSINLDAFRPLVEISKKYCFNCLKSPT